MATQRPALDPVSASALLREHFGLSGKPTPLPAWEEQNFLVEDGEKRAVFKVAPPEIPPLELEAQVAALERLASSPVAHLVPRVLPAKNGSPLVAVRLPDSRTVHLRVLTWLEGKRAVDAGTMAPPLLEKLGAHLAELDGALAGFEHPGARREHPWDLARSREVILPLDAVRDPRRRQRLAEIAERFRARVTPLLSDLPRSVIHNDANDYNILVDTDEQGEPGIAGLIDFGDMLETITVAELAIACTYAMLGRDNPLEAAAALVRGYHGRRPLSPAEASVLYDLVAARLATSAVHAARGREREPDNDYLTISEQPVWALLDTLEAHDPDLLTRELAAAAGGLLPAPRSADEILAIRRRHLGPNLSISYDEPLKIVRGEGAYLFDSRGRDYLDLVNNVCHVGHCHPRVVEAATRQMALLNTNTRFLHDNLAEYTRRLADTMPGELSVCFLVCSGTEANDLALRLAEAATSRREAIVVQHAYHGHSPALIPLGTYKCEGPGGRGLAEHARAVPLPDTYRGPHRGSDAAERYVDHVRQAADELAREGRPAAFFLAESLAGCGGQIIPPEGFLPAAFDAIREAGGVAIADEVQVGFGRVGNAMWAFDSFGARPDIVTLGKPIGNGHPMAAVVTTPEVAKAFDTGMEYFNTFGGNPVSCAVGLAVLDVIEDEGLIENARLRGAELLDGLRALAERHAIIGDVRGRGLFVGAELVRSRETREPAPDEADRVIQELRRRGILLSTDGPDHNVLKFKPPIVIGAPEIARTLAELNEILAG